MTKRTAGVTWQGSLKEGAGTIEHVTSEAFGPLDVSWPARTEEPNGKTSPEELLAAAHASCYSMQLAGALARAGHAPEKLATSATVGFQPGQGITGSELTVVGTVPGLSSDEFVAIAEDAKQNCPVSKALAVEITLDARLNP
jgi:osmotically inducible protein OsmC